MKVEKNYFTEYTSVNTLNKLIKLNNVAELIDKIKNDYQDQEAVLSSTKNYSFNDVYDETKKIVGGLDELNISEECNIGVLAGNDFNFVKASLGVMARGNTAVLLPASLPEQAIYGCSLKYQLKVVLYEQALEQNIVFAKNLLKDVLFIEINSLNKCGSFRYVEESRPACIVFTGGTTGKSKGAILSHRALLKGMINGCLGCGEVFGQTYYSMLPLTHVFGLIRNLLTSLYTGSKIYFCEDKRMMFKEIKTVRPTFLVLVPALAELFLNLMKMYGKDFLGGCVEQIICGAASVPPYLIQEYNQFGIKLSPGYGLTELANLVSGNPEGLKNSSSVGFFYPDQEYKIVDGELWIKGENLMDGYYNEPEENKNAFVDGWFKTGDLVRVDDEGFLYITGRIKDIIVLPNGENVSPAYLESKIGVFDFIQDSLVYEDKSELGAVILTVEVTLRQSVMAKLNVENPQSFVESKINELNNQLQDYERISKVIIRTTDFERSPSMKIIRPKRA